MVGPIEIRIFFMLIGVILGFIITWTFVSHRFWSYKYYKEEFQKYYEKWYKLDRSAFECWWISRDLFFKDYKPEEIKKKTDNIFFNLNTFYGDDE